MREHHSDIPLAELEAPIDEMESEEKVVEGSREATAADKTRQDFFQYLEYHGGIVDHGPNGEPVCDLDVIFSMTKEEYTSAIRPEPRHGYQSRLIELFGETPIFSAEDYQRLQAGDATIKPKPLFYVPENTQEAFNVEQLRRKEFYRTVGDFTQTKWSALNKFFLDQYGCTAEEAELAVKIFHPRFGRGFRNEDGALQVFDAQTEKYQSITGDWVRQAAGLNSMITRAGRQTHKWSSPKEALSLPECQRLKASGILRADDFKQQEGYGRADTLIRRESAAGARGVIFIDGAKYTLGTEFEGRPIVKLEPGLYGIVEDIKGFKKISHTFQTLPPAEIEQRQSAARERTTGGELKKQKSVAANVSVRRGEIDIVPYQTTASNLKREDEAPAEYAERIRSVANYEMLQQLSRDLTEQAGVGIHNLSLKEQEWLSSHAYSLESRYDQIVEFARQYKVEGLKAFIAAEYGEQAGDAVIAIGNGKKYGETAARETFRTFADVAAQAYQISQTIADHELVRDDPAFAPILDQLPTQLREAIVRRAKDTLFAGAAVARDGRAKARFYGDKPLEVTSASEVVKSLNDYRAVLEKINCLLQPAEPKKSYQFQLIDHEAGTPESHQFAVTNRATGTDSFLTLQLRPYGAAVGEHNSQREYDGEARINFLFSNEPIPLDATDPKRQQAMSIRLDREGKERSGTTIVANDPTQQAGELSLDISSSDQTLGRVVAIGNALAAESAAGRQADPQYLHNRESFNRTLGEAETFAHIAKVISQQIKQHYPTERLPA